MVPALPILRRTRSATARLAMLVRTVRLTFDPAALPAFDALFAATRDAIRAQPGCHHLELWADARYPAVRQTYSLWDDQAALDAYRHTDLFRDTWARTKALFAAPPVATSWTRIDGSSVDG